MKFIDQNNFQELVDYQEQRLFIPVLSDYRKHYTQNQLSFIYIYGLETFQEFIIGFNHNDTCGFKIRDLNDLNLEGVYCYKKKYLIDYRAKFKAYEAELVVWFETNKKIEVNFPNTIRQYWNWYPEIENINDSIPIMKWLEYCRDIKDRFVQEFNNFQIDESFLKYNQLLTDLEQIERNGLYTST